MVSVLLAVMAMTVFSSVTAAGECLDCELAQGKREEESTGEQELPCIHGFFTSLGLDLALILLRYNPPEPGCR